jgi:hypothetical protein
VNVRRPVWPPARALSMLSADCHCLRAEIFAEKVRTRLYAPMSTRTLPAVLALAAKGDLAAFSIPGDANGRVFADWVYLSITCAESLGAVRHPGGHRQRR